MDNQPPHIPVIVERETSAQDVAQILKAADNTKRSLSAVEYGERIPHLNLQPHHMGAAAAVLILGVGLAIGLFTSSFRYGLAAGLLVGTGAALFLFLVAVVNLNSEKHYFVEFTSEQEQSERVIKLEVHRDGNRINYYNLPDWLDDAAIVTLAQWAKNKRGFVFNRENCSRSGICSQRQFPQLRDSFLQADLAEQQGSQYSLTAEFFALADRLTVDES